VAVHRLRNLWRHRQRAAAADMLAELDQLEDSASDLSRGWDAEHDQYVTRRLLEMIEPEFQPATWQAFRRVMLEAASAREVADELGMTPNAVWIAKSRVLHRLREEAAGLID
jgi:RNA polymerase sigma-70 factor (ECF subfamily)